MKNPQFEVNWVDKGAEPTEEPDPNYPHGVDIDVSQGKKACLLMLVYPALRCGHYEIRCRFCGLTAIVTTAGRKDDPRSVKLACKVGKN